MSAPSIAAVPRARYSSGTVWHRFIDASLRAVGPREFRGNAASPDLQCDGLALDLLAGDLSRLNPGPLLWAHGAGAVDPTVGRVKSMTATATELPVMCEFFPAGVDPFADSLCKKLKSGGAPYGLSLAFTVEEWEWLPGRVGRCATRWTAIELSLTPTPVDAKAVITERSRRGAAMKQKAVQRIDDALAEHRAGDRHDTGLVDAAQRHSDNRRAYGNALRALRRALAAGDDCDPDDLADCCARALRAGDAVARDQRAAGASIADAGDSHGASQRALRAAGAALDADTTAIQSSGGTTADDQGSRSDHDRRLREADMLELAGEC